MGKRKPYVKRKITWKMILRDFKVHHPHAAKRIVYWRPHSYSEIVIYLDDGIKILYDYNQHASKVYDENI